LLHSRAPSATHQRAFGHIAAPLDPIPPGKSLEMTVEITRPLLEEHLSEGLSLAAIGERLGRNPSTISYHLNKHGLAPVNGAKYASRGGIERDLLATLVEDGKSVREIAAEVDRSPSTVRYWLQRHGLEVAGHGAKREAALAARDRGETTVQLHCASHGLTDFYVPPTGYYRCKRCRAERVARWRRQAKERLVAEFGGRCELCDYDACTGALQFHHVDPSVKDFGLAMRGRTRSMDKLRSEARKCVLVCANCHAEIERGVTQLPGRLLARFKGGEGKLGEDAA